MSQLKAELNSIVVWLHQQQKKYPDITQNWWLHYATQKNDRPYLKPKLSEEQIQRLFKSLDIRLNQEICDLYHSFNGTEFGQSIWESDWLFDVNLRSQKIQGVALLSLESLVKEYLAKKSFYQAENYQNLSLIPDPLSHFSGLDLFVGHQNIEGCSLLEQNKVSPTIRIREYEAGQNNTVIIYSGLTEMVQTINECYQKAYHIENHKILYKDLDKMLAIWQKYNANDLLTRTITRFKFVEYRLIELELDISSAWVQEVGDLFLLTKNKRLLVYLIAIITKHPANTVLDVRLDSLRSQASKIIVRSRSSKAISLLLKQLNNSYWIVRYWSVQTLGNMGEKSVIKFLNTLLSDEKELVRLATQRALNNLQKLQDDRQSILKIERSQHLNDNNLIEETDRLMKQLNYTVSEGKNYLRKHFNKHSRHHLKTNELEAFRDYLQNKLEEKNLNRISHFSTTINQSDCNNVEVIELEFSELIHEINLLMKQLKWTIEEGKAYILAHYGKKSRLLLTDAEILEFRDTLRQKITKTHYFVS